MKPHHTINCRTCRHILHEQSADLSADDRAALERHLRGCPACAASARRLDAALRVLRQMPQPEPSPYLAARIRAAAALQGRSRVPVPAWRVAPVAAGLAALLMLAWFAWPRFTAVPSTTPPGPVVANLTAPTPAPPVVGAQVPATLPAPAAELSSPLPAPPAPAVAIASRSAEPRARSASTPTPRRTTRSVSPAVALRPDYAPVTAPAAAPVPERAPAPVRLALAQPRQATPSTEARAASAPAFTDNVVGALIANVMLTTYLDAAPDGLQLKPVRLEGNGVN